MKASAAAIGMLALLGTLATAPAARAQGTINDGIAVFSIAGSHFDTSPSANLTGVSTVEAQDHLFEEGWWYRLPGDTAEHIFGTPDSQTYEGAVATLGWSDVEGRGFAAEEVDRVVNGGGPSGRVTLSLTITNSSPTTPLTIDVFHMADIDAAGTGAADVGTLANPNDMIHITDSGQTAEYVGMGASAFLVRQFGAMSVRTVLADAAVTDFDDTGLPFGPSDITAGFQWPTAVIGPSASQTFTVVIAVNMAATGGPTTTTTPSGATTSTTAPSSGEKCDDCEDDDGDGLVDLEDPDCCPAAAHGSVTLRKGVLRARTGGLAAVRLRGAFTEGGLLDEAAPARDLSVQLRGEGSVELLCARIPAASLVRRKGGLRFRDRRRTVTVARGIDRLGLGAKKVTVRGTAVELAVPGAGTVEITVGARDPAAGEASARCASGSAAFRATRKGLRFP